VHRAVNTVIFDLDGTVYQDTTFHRDYIRFLVADTPFAQWQDDLIQLVDGVFAGEHLTMNRFYEVKQVQARSAWELFCTLQKNLCPPLTYQEAVQNSQLIYLGDAWSVLTLMGEALGLLSGGRGERLYRKMREHMERNGMAGHPRLHDAIARLAQRCNVILMSNSYAETAREFLRQLGYDGLFPKVIYSANKPFAMIAKVEELDQTLFAQPRTVLSIGDHAFNDLMPIAEKGGRTVWINPFQGIARPNCHVELATLDDLADFLEEIGS